MLEDWKKVQLGICAEHDLTPVAVRADERLGIARNVRSGQLPINGVRYRPEDGMCGWYIWAGEKTDDDDFFDALHVAHLEDWCPIAMPFLQLPPGWCFSTDGAEASLWFEPEVERTSDTPRD